MARLLGASAMACVLAAGLGRPAPAAAQVLGLGSRVQDGSQMLLEADTLTYDRDKDTVTAAGNVQIEYGGNRLVARRVTYNQKTRRMVASGNVEVVDQKGNRVFSDEIDVTDDFRDGFVNALRAETAEKTYMAADSAERRDGALTIFNRGVYTACKPCEDKPDRPPIWRIKAEKVVWDGKEKTIRFHNSRFEFLGLPLIFMPTMEFPDPTVKQKTGFLIPGLTYKSRLGLGITQPFYVALAPTYDLTLNPTYYTGQGFLAAAEFRQRFNNGGYSVTAAGLRQNDPGAFTANTVDSGPAGDANRWRGMVGTKGRFQINPRWTFGWDVLLQSDKNFSYTYDIEGYNQFYRRSEAYLTGLSGRNYFDLRAMRFNVQEAVLDTSASALDRRQPWVLPSLDYRYILDEPVAGGELSFDLNAQALRRRMLHDDPGVSAVRGIGGNSGRLTGEVDWKRRFITDAGLVVTPLLALRGDAIGLDIDAASTAAIASMASNLGVAQDVRSAYWRYMATAGLELSWPVLFSTTSATHVLEPVAQVFARPSEPFAGALGLPNEDAQSFVFDASSLFERDKFAGYDRIEGGTRANIGFRYSGSFANGWSASGIFGESFQLAGRNSFASPDLVNVGAASGLETSRSDYVGLIGFTSPGGFSVSTGGRFDEKDFSVRRIETSVGLARPDFSVAARYAFIDAQPDYGFSQDRQQITLGASARMAEFWRVYGSTTYDTVADMMTASAFGVAYLDDCFGYSVTLSQTRNAITGKQRNNIGFNISLRTLGDFGSNTGNFGVQ
jgi:LPS-assembly protein